MSMTPFARPAGAGSSWWPAFLEEDYDPFMLGSMMPIRRPASSRVRTGPQSALMNVSPNVDVMETKDKMIIKAELPGLKKEDVNIELHNNVLTVSGKTEQSKEYTDPATSFRMSERTFGSFSRNVPVPPGLSSSEVEATLSEGILTVSLPLKVAEPKSEKIAIQMGKKAAE